METPAQKCARLVTALEDLVSQETVCLGLRDYAAVVQIQEQAAPLIEHLAAHAADVRDEKVRHRLAALLKRRNETCAALSAEVESTREQLNSLQVNQRRAAQVAPVYGRSTPPRRQFRAVG